MNCIVSLFSMLCSGALVDKLSGSSKKGENTLLSVYYKAVKGLMKFYIM